MAGFRHVVGRVVADGVTHGSGIESLAVTRGVGADARRRRIRSLRARCWSSCRRLWQRGLSRSCLLRCWSSCSQKHVTAGGAGAIPCGVGLAALECLQRIQVITRGAGACAVAYGSGEGVGAVARRDGA